MICHYIILVINSFYNNNSYNPVTLLDCNYDVTVSEQLELKGM